MKTYNFNICKYRVTITIEKRKYETTVKDVFDELTEKQKYKVIDRLKMAKDLVKSQPNEIKMEGEHVCFIEAAEKYIEDKRVELAASTIKGYENIIYHHLNDVWLIWLDKLTEEHLQNAFNNEIEKGLSEKTLKGYKSFILKVLAEYRPDFHPNIRVTKETANEIA